MKIHNVVQRNRKWLQPIITIIDNYFARQTTAWIKSKSAHKSYCARICFLSPCWFRFRWCNAINLISFGFFFQRRLLEERKKAFGNIIVQSIWIYCKQMSRVAEWHSPATSVDIRIHANGMRFRPQKLCVCVFVCVMSSHRLSISREKSYVRTPRCNNNRVPSVRCLKTFAFCITTKWLLTRANRK